MLYSKEIKGYLNLKIFLDALNRLNYTYDSRWQKESRTWKVYYHHLDKEKNKKIDDVPGEVKHD